MKPMTTPGKASGKVSIDTSSALPGNLWRCRNTPEMPLIASVAAVVAAATASVDSRLSR